MAASGVIGNQSDALCSNLFKKTKDLLTKDENKYLNHDIEKSIAAGYYFALYFCASECGAKAKKAGNKALARMIGKIEDRIDEMQKSSDRRIWNYFPETSDVLLLINENPPKSTVLELTSHLLSFTFEGMDLPVEFTAETDHWLFDKMKSYFVEEIKTNERVKNFLDTRLIAEIKDTLGSYLPQMNQKLDELLHSEKQGINRNYDLKIQLIRKFDSLFGVKPLSEALTVHIDDLPADLLAFYSEQDTDINISKSMDKDTDECMNKNTDQRIDIHLDEDEDEDNGEDEDDDGLDSFPDALSMLATREESENFYIAGEKDTLRLLFAVCRNESPFYLYLTPVPTTGTVTENGKSYQIYPIRNTCKMSSSFMLVSVVLMKDHAFLQTIQIEKGGYIDEFAVNSILEYPDNRRLDAEFENDDSEKEIFYSMENPSRIFTFIDLTKKCAVKPKIKYDYDLGAEYGSFLVNPRSGYLVLQLNFRVINREFPALDLYNKFKQLDDKSGEDSFPVRFARIIKTRLDSLNDLYIGDDGARYHSELPDYCGAQFRWTTLSSTPEQLISEMNRFISFLNDIMKKDTDPFHILALSDLQACATYNKGISYKKAGNPEKAMISFKKALKIVQTIETVQPDFQLRKNLKFYEDAVNNM